MQLNEFWVTVIFNGKSKRIKVETKPDSDDLDIYTCFIEAVELTQITKDNKKWKQVWGNLNDGEVFLLGYEIDKLLAE